VLNPLGSSNALVDEFNNATTAASKIAEAHRRQGESSSGAEDVRRRNSIDAAKKDAEDKESCRRDPPLRRDHRADRAGSEEEVSQEASTLAQTTAGQFIAADSTAAASFIQTVSAATKAIGDYVTAAALDDADVDAEDEKVLKAFEKRDDERTALLKAAPKNPAPGAFGAAVTAQAQPVAPAFLGR
jgi:hypothetical protein